MSLEKIFVPELLLDYFMKFLHKICMEKILEKRLAVFFDH